jgi:hypothetical protein
MTSLAHLVRFFKVETDLNVSFCLEGTLAIIGRLSSRPSGQYKKMQLDLLRLSFCQRSGDDPSTNQVACEWRLHYVEWCEARHVREFGTQNA